MRPERAASNDFWCPADETANSVARQRLAETAITPAEWAALSRLADGEWLSDAQIARLQQLGLAEIVFGHALLTRLGRSTLGTGERE